ncbi:uncharacterized protein [Symphalangus syndactylus]|uniref:uncharacterized protein n=1 Tax=Symphalangus syndactylus TaxID=9590 RepID=UPI0030065629
MCHTRRGAGLARDSWSNPEKPIRWSPSTSPPPAGLAQTPAGGGRAGGGGGGERVCARARAGGRVCACLRAQPLGALGNRLQDKCCPGGSATRALPGAHPRARPCRPQPVGPRTADPAPDGGQVTRFRVCHGDPHSPSPCHNKSHVFCRLEAWSGEKMVDGVIQQTRLTNFHWREIIWTQACNNIMMILRKIAVPVSYILVMVYLTHPEKSRLCFHTKIGFYFMPVESIVLRFTMQSPHGKEPLHKL